MDTTRKTNFNLEAIAWGALFILWGIAELFPGLPQGLGAIGFGLILIGLNLARTWAGQPTSGFTITCGILALLLGGLELVRPYLHLTFELPIFAILLLALGSITLIRAIKK
jgi:membrane-bound ClpP family serine protease